MRAYEIGAGPVGSAAGESPLHRVALLRFYSMATFQAALISPEGAATTADLGHFAQAGVELPMFDAREV